MSHVRPEKWADAFAGKLATSVVAQMEAHADACKRCATARDRVESASQSFPALRAQQAPDVAWDTVRARIHWSVSSEKRARDRAPRERHRAIWPLAGAGILGAAALTLVLVTGSGSSTPKQPVATNDQAPIAVTLVSPPAPVTGVVSRLAGQVMIDGVRRADAFERTLAVGNVIATGDGRIDVQFGADSAFALGPRSTLELHRFDAERIELKVEGTVDITVAPRVAGQRFVVIAGDQTVEVRGTQFRVVHDGASTQVACRHGKVIVTDSHGTAEVATARKLVTTQDAPLDPQHVRALTVDELDQLAQATPAMTPIWTDADSLVRTSAPLEISTTSKRAVRVDGVELGDAPLLVRVMPGRHTVETADAAGRFRRAGWVDIAAAKPARLVVQPDAAPTGGTAERRRQLHAGIDQRRLAQCTRAITKAGLASYVHVEIAIDETGAVGFLNIIDTDLSSSTASCVHDVLADVRFKPGASATFRDKIDL
ncbi:MAG TPA: FecR family protein [Kofleriaceae bacterium]|nr:FecR family protein [Kofleriaceae bacterium]